MVGCGHSCPSGSSFSFSRFRRPSIPEVLVFRKLVRGISWAILAAWSVAFTASTPIALVHAVFRTDPVSASDCLSLTMSWCIGMGTLLTLFLLEDVVSAFARARKDHRADEFDHAILAYRRIAAYACIPYLIVRMAPRLAGAAARRFPIRRARQE